MNTLIKQHVSLHDKNWFGTGGSARYYAEPTTQTELQEALFFAQSRDLAVFVLGEGANILISDEGFDGLVIRPALKEYHHQPVDDQPVDETTTLLTIGAGVSLHDAIDYCLAHQLCGLEEFSGIPGTIGGSVFINVHYYEFLLSHFMVAGRVIHKTSCEILDVPTAWFNFGYDYSTLHAQEYYLINATFSLKNATADEVSYAKGRRAEIIRHRQRRYPSARTCGSFFRNFHDHEVTLESNGKKMIFVAYYLDKLGFKGALTFGGATVSYQHANMIVTKPGATSQDIINLAQYMQERVYQEFGILPQAECQLIGFSRDPLQQLSPDTHLYKTPSLTSL